jgi:hypothetical protein
VGANIEFEVERQGNFWNLAQDSIPKASSAQATAKPTEEKASFPSVKDVAKETLEVMKIPLGHVEDDPQYFMQAWDTVFRELMLDRRTRMIQRFKQANMQNFRGRT